ncbi:MAG: pyridoxal 5'-phosphate synthase glutaminase subunit PdxT [Chloroflexi bacterium]|nr:pyridoxal 5'-phosphate synthase glutaminase subunit PdxT [Chloroflexota bacterium]
MRRTVWRAEAGSLPKIGVLAVQGDFLEHRQALERIGVDVSEVRLPAQLDGLDGLIIPGGESTTIVQLLDIYGFRDILKEKASNGLAIWGTCAGMIVIANKLTDKRPDPIKLMDIEVSRNAFGRQVDSFEQDLDVTGMEGDPFHAVFIRAPVVTHMGKDVEAIAKLTDGRPVAVQQGHLLATSFHPELTEDTRFHEYFVRIATRGSD